MLNYGGGFASKYDGLDGRFPKNAQPIETAPTATSKPIVVYDSDGSGHKALYYKGQWMRLQAVRDPYSGTTSYRMDSQLAVRNPIKWTPE